MEDLFGDSSSEEEGRIHSSLFQEDDHEVGLNVMGELDFEDDHEDGLNALEELDMDLFDSDLNLESSRAVQVKTIEITTFEDLVLVLPELDRDNVNHLLRSIELQLEAARNQIDTSWKNKCKI